MRAVAIALLFAGCTVTPAPLPPSPGPGDCETAHANVSGLGGCGMDMSRFVADCQAAEAAEKRDGVRFPVHCMSVERSCAAVWGCK